MAERVWRLVHATAVRDDDAKQVAFATDHAKRTLHHGVDAMFVYVVAYLGNLLRVKLIHTHRVSLTCRDNLCCIHNLYRAASILRELLTDTRERAWDAKRIIREMPAVPLVQGLAQIPYHGKDCVLLAASVANTFVCRLRQHIQFGHHFWLVMEDLQKAATVAACDDNIAQYVRDVLL